MLRLHVLTHTTLRLLLTLTLLCTHGNRQAPPTSPSDNPPSWRPALAGRRPLGSEPDGAVLCRWVRGGFCGRGSCGPGLLVWAHGGCRLCAWALGATLRRCDGYVAFIVLASSRSPLGLGVVVLFSSCLALVRMLLSRYFAPRWCNHMATIHRCAGCC